MSDTRSTTFLRIEGSPLREASMSYLNPLARILRYLLFRKLSTLSQGAIRIIDPFGTREFGERWEDTNLRTTVRITDPSFYLSAVFRGSIGAGEAFMDGAWNCDNLVNLIRIFARNQHLNQSVDRGFAGLLRPLFRVTHWIRRNSPTGSRKNIRAHYDLGNDFFSLFLDESMMYSAAHFPYEVMGLEEAATAKLDLICRQLKLAEGDRVIEIGSGWGGFAIHAASKYGAHITTTTISEKQFEYTLRRVQETGLSDRITVLKKDYRDLSGEFDKLVSIEMVEAVGHEFLDTYFAQCQSLLKPGGLGLIQAITIAEEFYEEARDSVDFIQRYIFPGSAIPSMSSLNRSIQRAGGLHVVSNFNLTQDYAQTLLHWRERFVANLDAVRQLGFSDRFLRMWFFYFCYCEGGFREGHTGDYQILLQRS